MYLHRDIYIHIFKKNIYIYLYRSIYIFIYICLFIYLHIDIDIDLKIVVYVYEKYTQLHSAIHQCRRLTQAFPNYCFLRHGAKVLDR